jgi:hypothetical protein
VRNIATAVLLHRYALSMEADNMAKLLIGVSAAALLSASALAQTDKNIPPRPDPTVKANQQTTGSKVSPLPAPDASTQPGQERGNAEIIERSTQTDKNIPPRPDPSVKANQQTTGSKVSPLPAPDASTQPGQERGNAEIIERSQQNAPGTGGTSKPGVAGLPGSKSGPTRTPEDQAQSGSSTPETLQQDQSKVPGMQGTKSGMAPKK